MDPKGERMGAQLVQIVKGGVSMEFGLLASSLTTLCRLIVPGNAEADDADQS